MNTPLLKESAVPYVQRLDLNHIRAALGEPSRVTYECAHVYPLSAPDFQTGTPARLARPTNGVRKLYIHVPFCNYACAFCFYVKQIGASTDRKRRIVDCLIKELESIELGTTLTFVYVGGGTPTALPPSLLDELLSALRKRTVFSQDVSFTIECSPESLEAEHLEYFKSHGVNRISIGVDTLNADILRLINRRHDREQALCACQALVETEAFVNVDLIYGFPGQRKDGFANDLRELAAIGPHSFTLYDLRLNEQTPLIRHIGQNPLTDLGELIEWRAWVASAAVDLGYVQTRWHTFVRQNIPPSNYMRAPCVDGFSEGRQLGIGPSSLSHLGYRLYRNIENIEAYATTVEKGDCAVDSMFELGTQDQHTLFVARTLGDGEQLSRLEYERAFGHPIEDDFGSLLSRLTEAGLLSQDDQSISLTSSGRLVYDLVMRSFYPAKATKWLNQRQSFL